MAGQDQITLLAERLDGDSEFISALEADPFDALREAGLADLADDVERERARIAELIDQIYRDDAFRRAVEEDPSGKLGDYGIPEVAIQPLLLAAGAPSDVLERATADVEGHLSLKKPMSAAAAAAMLAALAFAGEVSAASPATSAQVKPGATAQVSSPAVSAQVTRAAASAQFRPATATAQTKRAAAISAWQVSGQRAEVQQSIVSILRAYTG